MSRRLLPIVYLIVGLLVAMTHQSTYRQTSPYGSPSKEVVT